MATQTRTAGTYQWVDITAPTERELQELAQTHSLPSHVVADCLDPKHLPKYEELESAQFMIVRVFDPHSSPDASTIRELTRKVAIFWSGDLVVTIHRAALPFLEKIALSNGSSTKGPKPTERLVLDVLKAATLTFEIPLQRVEERLEAMESRSTLVGSHVVYELVELHSLRNSLSTFKRLLFHTETVLRRIQVGKTSESLVQHLKETVEGLLFFADELLEDTTSLISLELSVASERTSHIMRVLTIFSVFFMPLTFIVGVYGMNFEHQPEFKWMYGYPFIWFVMIVVTLAIALWFRAKRWL